jgi:hypothetical protein
MKNLIPLIGAAAILLAANSLRAADKLSEGLTGFSGMLVGTLVKKDTEKGALELKVVSVKHVWRNNKARQPYSIIGKTVAIDGVFGKFIDALITIKVGGLLEIEVQQKRGNTLRFPGEWLRKAEAIEPAELAKLKNTKAVPSGLVGFSGQLLGKIISRDAEKGTVVLQIEKVQRVWRPNKAKNPYLATGRTLPIDGVRGKFLDVLITCKPGDRIQIEAKHERGDRLRFLGEGLIKVGSEKEKD